VRGTRPSHLLTHRARPAGARHPRRLTLRRWRRSPLVFWIAALALAVAAAGLADGGDDPPTSSGDTRLVPVARNDLDRGRRLDGDDVEWTRRPSTDLPRSPAAETEGRVVTEPIAAGEVVVESRLAPGGAGGTTALLPAGTRAIAVPSTLGTPPLEIGDHVDLLATLEARAVARDAVVVATSDDAVTVAVDEGEAIEVAAALASGGVVLALVSVG
jgi:Flp pilus assembly protein CpaB